MYWVRRCGVSGSQGNVTTYLASGNSRPGHIAVLRIVSRNSESGEMPALSLFLSMSCYHYSCQCLAITIPVAGTGFCTATKICCSTNSF